MRGFGFVPEWSSGNTAPGRTHEKAYFPVSLSATVREATFSETLSGILGADPSHSLDELKMAVSELRTLEGHERTTEELWEAFKAGYTISSSTYGSSGRKGDYLIPFHRAVAIAIKVEQGRRWWRLYWLLMTDGSGTVDKELHDQFVKALYDLSPSNLLEELIIEAIEGLDEVEIPSDPTSILTDDIYLPITPLVPECAEAFREDLRAWLELRNTESTSRWMRGLRDILCYHYMMYVIQVAIGLDEEYEAVESGGHDEFEFSLNPVYFGLANETASKSRNFATAWSEDGLSRAMYDSWGRLAVLRHLVSVGLDDDTPIENRAYTLSEALDQFPETLKQTVVERLLDEFPEEQRPDDEYELGEAAIRFSHAVRRYYENMAKSRSSQTAWSAGENSVIDLGRGAERQFIERRQRVGTILRLDRSGLRLFARLFDAQRAQGHIDEFWSFLRDRGIELDRRSRQELIEQLEGMGLLQKQSDSGEAMYVETV